jgi:hypothetical protein
MKNLDQAIEYVLNNHSCSLFHKGENYATFTHFKHGLFDIVKSYQKNLWYAYIEHGSYNAGYTEEILFTIPN